jgi:hypothetical protein
MTSSSSTRLHLANASVLALSSVLSVACIDAKPIRPDVIADAASQVSEGSSRPLTMDDEYEALVDSIPGFGGWYVDENHNPTVVLVDTSRRELAEQRLKPRIERAQRGNRAGRQIIGSTLRVQRGTFDFKQLRGWAKVAERLMDSEMDAVYVDSNEGTNRVEVGVSSSAGVGRFTRALMAAGVPEQAFDVRLTSPIRSMTDLNARIRPIPGGVYISYPVSGGTSNCTLGFNVSLSAVGPIGFATNSHCSPAFGSVSPSTDYRQNSGSTNTVGDEMLDPSPWQNTSDCISFRNLLPMFADGICRYSDALISDYDSISEDSVDFGYIARTTWRAALNVRPGSATINSSNKHFEIASKYYSIPQGVYLDRLGTGGTPMTGWTYHNVSSACATIIAPKGVGSGYKKMWCQHKMGGGNTAVGGDSGGPLWTYDYCDNGQLSRPDGTECISLAGIFWGGDGDRLWFSQIGNVEIDFGLSLGVRPADKP